MGLGLRACPVLQGLGRGSPLEGFARPWVGGGRYRIEAASGMAAEIRALREVLAEQAVGVLRSSLPRTPRVAKVYPQAAIDPYPHMFGEFRTLIPGQ